MEIEGFKAEVWEWGQKLYREMPWREDTRPYYVLVSELMLQQTQVERVVPKFHAFIAAFPSEKVLAEASLAEVLKLWSGLGYNRRAKFLHEAAKSIVRDFNGEFPSTKDELQRLPGVGVNTAGAILTYAFNQPVPFIETNVRTVFFHHFFENREDIADREIRIVLEKAIDQEHPREFYWALMDYGTYLKKNGAGKITRSKHYKKQSVLKGSVREVRGQIIRVLAQGSQTIETLKTKLLADERFELALSGLLKDGLVQQDASTLYLTK